MRPAIGTKELTQAIRGLAQSAKRDCRPGQSEYVKAHSRGRVLALELLCLRLSLDELALELEHLSCAMYDEKEEQI